MSEEWRDIPGFGGHYEASSLGRLRAKERTVLKKGGALVQRYAARILTGYPEKYGHMRVRLGWNNQDRSYFVHRLVLLAFVGPCPDGMEACHNNGDSQDNRIENLRWDTHLENNRDRKRHGRYATGPAHHFWKGGAAA